MLGLVKPSLKTADKNEMSCLIVVRLFFLSFVQNETYSINQKKKKSVCVCVWGGGRGGRWGGGGWYGAKRKIQGVLEL